LRTNRAGHGQRTALLAGVAGASVLSAPPDTDSGGVATDITDADATKSIASILAAKSDLILQANSLRMMIVTIGFTLAVLAFA
jgi:hypothetical protein